jgi:ethanolamine ammonia-lyase small subunit
LRALTPARIALGRVGQSLPTDESLRFALAHAQARDAVHAPFAAQAMAIELTRMGLRSMDVASQASDRRTYLRRPDLGRRLSDSDRSALAALPPASGQFVVVIADGLSPAASQHQAVALLERLLQRLNPEAPPLAAPIVFARQARVALGDDVAVARGAAAVVVLIGERPGLSAPDSLGAYITWAPRIGCRDAQRNCLSNIRPQGLCVDDAARRIAWLLDAARRHGATGVTLKDESELSLAPASAHPAQAGLMVASSSP